MSTRTNTLKREQAKDAFDILYTLQHYDGGLEKAVAAFAEEVAVGNPASMDAVQSLEKLFRDESAPGPVKASHFILGPASRQESEDARFRRILLRQDMVNAASRLLDAISR